MESICKEVIKLSIKAGLYQKKENESFDQSRIESKGANDFVSYVDKESEKQLIEGLSKILPEAGFMSEENYTEIPPTDYFWVIDPLDGTSNYVHKLFPYSVSIALMHQKEVILGCVHEVSLGETFYAWKGGKAWLNEQPIRVSQTPRIHNSMIAYGIPYIPEPAYEYVRDGIRSLYGKCTLRHMGSAAAELCYVAAGRTDAYFHDHLSPWDVAAGSIILTEAGGKITDFSSEENFIFGKEVVATNGLLHEELLNVVGKKQ